jgi:inner membrane protein involved in colicin E2 resistance
MPKKTEFEISADWRFPKNGGQITPKSSKIRPFFAVFEVLKAMV